MPKSFIAVLAVMFAVMVSATGCVGTKTVKSGGEGEYYPGPNRI